jgi:ELWxxDGT repeat protein
MVVFRANDGSSGFELWKSDGTEAGTIRLTDNKPGTTSSISRAFTRKVIGDTFYFTADDEAISNISNLTELWKSDGTPEGTERVADIFQGSFGSNPGGFASIGNTLIFQANDGTSGNELWRSDGTAFGTRQIADINFGPYGSNPAGFTPIGNSLLFSAFGEGGRELWKTDGITAERVANINPFIDSYPGFLTAFGNTVFF